MSKEFEQLTTTINARFEQLTIAIASVIKRLEKVEERTLILAGMINTFIRTASISRGDEDNNEEDYDPEHIMKIPGYK